VNRTVTVDLCSLIERNAAVHTRKSAIIFEGEVLKLPFFCHASNRLHPLMPHSVSAAAIACAPQLEQARLSGVAFMPAHGLGAMLVPRTRRLRGRAIVPSVPGRRDKGTRSAIGPLRGFCTRWKELPDATLSASNFYSAQGSAFDLLAGASARRQP